VHEECVRRAQRHREVDASLDVRARVEHRGAQRLALEPGALGAVDEAEAEVRAHEELVARGRRAHEPLDAAARERHGVCAKAERRLGAEQPAVGRDGAEAAA